MLNERFYPGGGEDYDFNRRAKVHGFSCISTTQSWVFHHWGLSRNLPKRDQNVLDAALAWNNLNELWGPLRDRARVTPQDLPVLTQRPL
jgi:hypothetical protein